MHAFVRRGLLLSAVTGTLVMGYAGSAAAVGAASPLGAVGGSPGAVSGNVAQVPVDVPIPVRGDAATIADGVDDAAVTADTDGADSSTDDATAEALDLPADSPGAVSASGASAAVGEQRYGEQPVAALIPAPARGLRQAGA